MSKYNSSYDWRNIVWDPYAEFESTTIPNGIELYATHWSGRPWEYIGITVHTGSEHDPEGLEGLAHYVEHLVSGNSLCPRDEISAFIENNGGKADFGRTGYFYSKYQLKVPLEQSVLKRVLDFFGHMILCARLEQEIENERKVIVGEYHMKYRSARHYEMACREHKEVYRGYWQERCVCSLGTPASVSQISGDSLQQHYDKYYVPQNITIVGVGGLTPRELHGFVCGSKLSMSKDGTRTPRSEPVSAVKPLERNRHEYRASEIMIGMETGSYRTVAKIPGDFSIEAVSLATDVLDYVLTEEVRERRAWTYDISCARNNMRNFYEISVACGSLAAEAMADIERVVDACTELASTRVDLLERFRKRAITMVTMLDPTAGGICDGAMNDLTFSGRIVSLKEYSDGLRTVTASELRKILQLMRPEMRFTQILIP